MKAAIRTERGTPRLFINDRETYPLFGWSWSLQKSVPHFRRAGVDMLHPVFGLNVAWPAPDRYDFSAFDGVFANLLAANPDAVFLPRVLLDPPDWWRDAYPEELVQYGAPLPENRAPYRPMRLNPEGGWLWGIQTREPSLASARWREDMDALLRAFLRHIEGSSVVSRIAGYQVGAGIYGEWHYYASQYVPDYSPPVQRTIGPVPSLEDRATASLGLLRDPAREGSVIAHYRRLHEEIGADALLHFARVVKEETGRRVLCGAFYLYLLENVFIQEAGHLAPEKVITSPDIDFIASPYSYQRTNIPGREKWENDVVDGGGNALGRARGIGGDGGYRVLLESLRRHNKLYFVELDATTFLEPRGERGDGSDGSDVEQELHMLGGEGCDTVEGTERILRRDLGQVFVKGNGGWLFDFGPVLRTKDSWYADKRITDLVASYSELGQLREQLDHTSCSEIAAVYDTQSLFATRHWRADGPGSSMDYFSTWFLDSQARALHRIGAPVDFLYRFDLTQDDARSYRLLLFVNCFYLTDDEITRTRARLRGSGTTAVWYYAPGYLSPDAADVDRASRLTGIELNEIGEGSMCIRCVKDVADGLVFGVEERRGPRFSVIDPDARVLGRWNDSGEAAFALKQVDGWTSIYVGSAPLPPVVLRRMANLAGAELWSDRADLVMATRDAAMLVATDAGTRTLTLPRPMFQVGSAGPPASHFALDLAFGESALFTALSPTAQ